MASAAPTIETMARDEHPAGAHVLQGEAVSQTRLPISGPAPICDSFPCHQCIAPILTVGTVGIYHVALTSCCADCLLWHGIVDFSSPVHFRLADGELMVSMRSWGCRWSEERFAEQQVEQFVVLKEDTHWGPATVRVASQHGLVRYDEKYELIYGAPRPLTDEADVARARGALQRRCSDDTSCRRACEQCVKSDQPCTTCLTGELSVRQGFPCVSLAAKLRDGAQSQNTPMNPPRDSNYVRISRRRWLARDLDALERLAARLNSALPAPVVEGRRVSPEAAGLGGRVPIVVLGGEVGETLQAHEAHTA